MKVKRFHKVDKNKVLQSNFQNFNNQENEEELDAEHYAALGFIKEGLKQKGVNLDKSIKNLGESPDEIAETFKNAIDYTLAHRSQRIDLLDPGLGEKDVRRFAKKVAEVLRGSLTNDQVLSGINAYRDFGIYSKNSKEEREFIRNKLSREEEITYVSEFIDKHISIMDRIKAFKSEVKTYFSKFGKDEDNKFSMGEALVDTIGVFGLAASGAVKIVGGESGKMRVDDKINGIKDAITQKVDGVKDGVEQKVTGVKNGVDQKIDAVVGFVGEKQEKLEEKMAILKEKTINFFPNLVNAFKQRITEVANNAIALKNGVVKSINEGIDKTVETVVAVKDKTVEAVNDGIDKTVKTVNNGIDKTVETVVAVKDKTVEVVHNGVEAVVSAKNKTVDAVNDGVNAVKQFALGDKAKHLENIRKALAERNAELASNNRNTNRPS